MENLKEKIFNYYESHKKELRELLIKLLEEMVAQPTVNVPSDKLGDFPYLKIRGEEYKVANIVKREFDKWGIKYDEYYRIKERPNVIGKIGKGASDKKLLVAAHMDIVPPGDGWETDPFKLTIKGDLAYGRGVLDNKGPLISGMLAGKILKEVIGEENIEGEFLISALSDEEASDPDGVDYGIHFLLEEGLIKPTYAIIPDIGENMLKIDIAEKGRMVIKITAVGKQAHGSTPERGINAINKMARFLTLLENYTLKYEPDPVLKGPTVNVGEIKGGAAANIVPAECTTWIDIRIVPGQTPEGVKEELKELSKKIAEDFIFEIEAATLPHKISPDNILVKAIQNNSQKYFNFKPEPFGLGGGTFAKSLNLFGITAVGFGPGDDTAFHVANEYVSITQLLDFACLLALVALDLI